MSQPKLVLFTDKEDTPGMFRALAASFQKYSLHFFTIHSSDQQAMKQFSITKVGVACRPHLCRLRLLTWLLARLLTCLLTCLLPYASTYLLSCLLTRHLACLVTSLLACLLTCFLTCPVTCLLTCLFTCLLTCLYVKCTIVYAPDVLLQRLRQYQLQLRNILRKDTWAMQLASSTFVGGFCLGIAKLQMQGNVLSCHMLAARVRSEHTGIHSSEHTGIEL